MGFDSDTFTKKKMLKTAEKLKLDKNKAKIRWFRAYNSKGRVRLRPIRLRPIGHFFDLGQKKSHRDFVRLRPFFFFDFGRFWEPIKSQRQQHTNRPSEKHSNNTTNKKHIGGGLCPFRV